MYSSPVTLRKVVLQYILGEVNFDSSFLRRSFLTLTVKKNYDSPNWYTSTITEVTHGNTSEGLVLRGSATHPIIKKRTQSLPNFIGASHMCLHPFIQNDRIRRGNTYKEGLVLGVNHTPS